jgi:SAM-dependent methyltransferase
MCLRLKDFGMSPTGCDLVVENFRLHDIVPFVAANFNQVFPVEFLDRFEGVVASEIIEHLENPRQFLRQVFSILKPGGQLILTTPNVDNAFSRAMLVRFGTFNGFRQQQYAIDGHITPLPLMVLRNAMAEAGFNILEVTSVGGVYFQILVLVEVTYTSCPSANGGPQQHAAKRNPRDFGAKAVALRSLLEIFRQIQAHQTRLV